MKIKLDDSTPFPGEYEFDLETPLTNRELHVIKEVAKVRAGELDDSIAAGDSDVFVALATIAMVRAGKVDRRAALEAADLLMDVPATAITTPSSADLAAEPDPPTAPSGNGADGGSKKNTPSS